MPEGIKTHKHTNTQHIRINSLIKPIVVERTQKLEYIEKHFDDKKKVIEWNISYYFWKWKEKTKRI